MRINNLTFQVELSSLAGNRSSTFLRNCISKLEDENSLSERLSYFFAGSFERGHFVMKEQLEFTSRVTQTEEFYKLFIEDTVLTFLRR